MTNLKQIQSTLQTVSHLNLSLPLVKDLALITARKKMGLATSIEYPLNINLEITYLCNAYCHFCINAPGKANMNISKENHYMSLEMVEKILSELPKNKCHFFITGGEPFLHKDLFEIIGKIKTHGHSCGMVTNAVFLNDEKVQMILRLGLDYIIFSIHGNREHHDAITRIPGSFDKLIRAIERFNANDLEGKCTVHVNSVMTKDNLDSFDLMIESLERVKISSLRIAHPSFNLKHEIDAFNQKNQELLHAQPRVNNYYLKEPELKPETVLKFMDKMSKRKTRFKIHFKPLISKEEVGEWYSANNNLERECFFLFSAVFINPDGNVLPCQTIKYTLGNVKENTIQEIWNGEKYRALRKQISKKVPPVCRRCCKL